MRSSRPSWASTRSDWPSGVPYFSAWMRLVYTERTFSTPVRVPRFS
jgi:hypothetical protein